MLTKPQKQALAWCVIALIAWALLKLLGPVLTPFVVALVLAYSLSPAVSRLVRLSRGKLPHVIAVILVELGFVAVVLAVLLLVVPILAKEIPLLQAQLPQLIDRMNATLSPLLASWGFPYSIDASSAKDWVLKYLQANADEVWATVLPSLKLGGGVVLSLVGYVVLVPVVLFYLLQEWEGLLQKAWGLIPRKRLAFVRNFAQEADAVLGQYMRGQLMVMLTLALFYSIGLALWGLDLALPIGVFTGLAMCIPYIGFGIGLVLAFLAGMLEFTLAKTVLMLITVYGTGQVLEGFYLTPRWVGERIGLHPLAVIFALLAFGQLFGFIGVLVALPVSAVLLVALRRLRERYLASPLYLS